MRSRAIFAICALLAAGSAARGQTLIVVNQGDATVSLVDPVSLTVAARLDEGRSDGSHVHEAAVSLDGETALLPVYGDSAVGKSGVDGREILFVDLKSRSIVGALDFGRGVRPHQAVTDPTTGLVYVTTELDQAVAVIDPKTRRIVGRVPTGAGQSHMLVLSHDGRYGYTANVGPGSVSVMDLQARRALAVIPVADAVQRIALSADDKLVFTSDAKLPRLAVIDIAARAVRQWIPLPAAGYGAAVTKDGRWLLIALPALNEEGVIDLSTMTLVRTIPVGAAPQETLIRPDGRVAYVSCAASGTVSAIDLVAWKVTGTVRTALGADGLAWAAR